MCVYLMIQDVRLYVNVLIHVCIHVVYACMHGCMYVRVMCVYGGKGVQAIF